MKNYLFILPGTVIMACFNLSGQLWREPLENTKKQPQINCMECHSNLMDQQFMHSPVEDACDNCHIPNENEHPMDNVKGFDLSDQMPALCFLCHEENTQSTLHAPVEMGECLMCHSAHGSPNKSLLLQSPESMVCAECHDMSMTEKPVKHTPVATGNCSECHDPHQSDLPVLLKTDKPGLCLDCHESAKGESSLPYIHYPFEDDCANCHDTHSSEEGKLLIQKTPDLCFNCHDMQSTIQEARIVHKVINDDKGCANCHSAHASEQGRLLIAEGKQLCLSCHNKTLRTNENTISNIDQLLRRSSYIHAVIEMDGCTPCHNPHSSDQSSLLNGTFPEGLYSVASAENFDLCFTCHDSELMLAEFSSTATNFRNGEQNLHYLHINGNKGRNCNVCHDMHASVNNHLIRETVLFGNWEMPVEYTSNENGGSCGTGCHAEKDYAR